MMWLWNLIHQIVDRITKGKGHGVQELARRLGLSVEELLAVQPSYQSFLLPKRSGGTRRIVAPNKELKSIQRRILRRLLARLRCHTAATGFERGHSIVTNARQHVGKAVIVQMDIKDFFPSTHAQRVNGYFRKIGWNREAAAILVRLCTHEGGLPQGAPTSPRLSNLVNYRLDAFLSALANRRGLGRTRKKRGDRRPIGGTYTRYADDLTFSFAVDDGPSIRRLISATKGILAAEGYELHTGQKLHIRRRHAQQLVTGLVVNQRVSLPRSTRRWLRAVEHRAATRGFASLTYSQRVGWAAFQQMIEKQEGNLPHS